MGTTTVAGIDPGLVHTGLVVLEFSKNCFELSTSHAVIDGLDPDQTKVELEMAVHPRSISTVDIFTEHYRPRSGFGTNERMVWANSAFPATVGGKALRNPGVLNIVQRPLLELLGLWSWPTPTHHADLRSAARIAILGMMRDEYLNRVLYTHVTHRLETP